VSSRDSSSLYRRNALTRSRGLAPLLIGIIGMLISSFVVGSFVADNDWNPTTLVKFPEQDPAALAYAEDLLGDIVPAPGLGHDGKFYFVQAMDPFFLDPDQHAIYLDRPTYRAQRMIYPLLAGGFGLFSPGFTVWAMIVVNLIAVGVGTWLTALLARELGLPAFLGMAFALNPGILVSALVDTAEVFAMLFFVLAAFMILRDRMLAASIALTLAALTRETMILATFGVVAYLVLTKRRRPVHLALPIAISGIWWIYLRWRLGALTDSVQDTQAIGLPFAGFADAFQRWLNPLEPADLLMGIVLVALAVIVPWRAIQGRSLVGLMAAGFSLIAIIMSEPVWLNYFDSSRVLAPLITAYLLMIPFPGRSSSTTTVMAPNRDRDEPKQLEEDPPSADRVQSTRGMRRSRE